MIHQENLKKDEKSLLAGCPRKVLPNQQAQATHPRRKRCLGFGQGNHFPD